jgi:hypothetical protein
MASKRKQLKFGFSDSDPGGDTLKRLAAAFTELGQKPSIKVGVLGNDDREGAAPVAAAQRGASAGAGSGGASAGASAGSGGGPGGIDNVRLAAIHEFGAPKANIPARSFLRATMDENREAYFGMLIKAADAILESRTTIAHVLAIIGERVKADIQARIRAQTGFAPLQPETIARKRRLTRAGSTGPVKALIDTGQLLASITYKVMAPSKTLAQMWRARTAKAQKAGA